MHAHKNAPFQLIVRGTPAKSPICVGDLASVLIATVRNVKDATGVPVTICPVHSDGSYDSTAPFDVCLQPQLAEPYLYDVNNDEWYTPKNAIEELGERIYHDFAFVPPTFQPGQVCEMFDLMLDKFYADRTPTPPLAMKRLQKAAARANVYKYTRVVPYDDGAAIVRYDGTLCYCPPPPVAGARWTVHGRVFRVPPGTPGDVNGLSYQIPLMQAWDCLQPLDEDMPMYEGYMEDVAKETRDACGPHAEHHMAAAAA
jgi:hypothetical protein